MILTLIRDDGEKLEFSTANGYSTEASDDWFDSKPITNSTITYAGADGGALIVQNYGMFPITISGSLHANTLFSMREKAKELARFLAKNHYFTAIFTECDGTQMASHNVFVSTPPAITMRSKLELARKYSFQITLTDPYLYEYATDAEGNEVYANKITIPRFSELLGGYQYVGGGYIYLGGGYAYQSSGQQYTNIDVDTVSNVAPVWVVKGKATNPTITNLTTDTKIAVSATIVEGQTLTVDMANRTAYIGTADLTDSLTGEWLVLADGENILSFTTDDSEDYSTSTLEWNGVVF